LDSLSSPGNLPVSADVPRPQRALASRVVTGVLGGALTVALVILGQPWLFLGVATVVVIGLREFYRMAERAGYRPVWEAGIVSGVLFVAAAAYPAPWASFVMPALVVYTVLVQLRAARPQGGLGSVGVTLLGALYVGYLFSYLVRLRTLPFGPAHAASPLPALLVICVVWSSDSAAYFVGLAWGRRKLLPHVSPHKSLEGAAAAVLAGIVAGLVFAKASGIALALAGVVGLVCALASIAGDLWESAIKREVGVKDAGLALPGHGGMLDRFDGLLFAVVAGYAVLVWWSAR